MRVTVMAIKNFVVFDSDSHVVEPPYASTIRRKPGCSVAACQRPAWRSRVE
jgi:hypothetical protein